MPAVAVAALWALLLCLCVAPARGARAVPTWGACQMVGRPILNVTDVRFAAPPPSSRGHLWLITVTGFLNSHHPVVDGIQRTDVWWGRLKVQTKESDYCAENLCPILPGPTVQSVKALFPWLTPPGTYTVEASSRTREGQFISCLRLSFPI
eukprot:TRINITY_DN1469_c0_g1_i1.p2 TRINITY_DN1469_c0_g1~~TRINITY_DN1469_c0_g1_i1.p2  ORF type:complete len:158 (-),score=33.27 TRINITY_DN1469_c0_g1_i1:594-1046(-)